MAARHVVFGVPSAEATNVADRFAMAAKRLEKLTTGAEIVSELRSDLTSAGWSCADGSRARNGVHVATSAGDSLRVDARHPGGTVLWVETGRSWQNFAFLEHAVEASRAPSIGHVVVALLERYKGKIAYANAVQFMDDLVASDRLTFPYASLLFVGF